MLKHSSNWIAYTTDKNFAEKFKVEDNKPIHFIKNKRYQEYLRIHWSYKKFYRCINKKYYVLPPSKWFNIVKKKWELKISDWLHARQKEWVEHVVNTYNEWKKSSFLISWTWTGKWHILPSIINSFDGLNILVLAPNNVVWERLMDDLWDLFFQYVRWKKILEFEWWLVLTLYKTFNMYFDHINSKFDIVIIDEWHHVWWQLETNLYLWKSFILWMSATPYRNEYNEDWFKMFFWDMYDTEKQALPVKVYEYKFKYEYAAEDVIAAQEWLPTTSPEIYRRLIIWNKSRYEDLVLIIENVSNKWFRNFIVFSDRLDHISKLEEILKNEFSNKHVVVIKWESDVLKIMEELKDRHDIIIIWSTSVVKEGMNIPQLEVWILFTSSSFKWWIDQMVGRVRRFYWDKEFGYFIDFQDYISIAWSKYKSPWVYSRRKAYKSFWWSIWNLVTEFI